MLPNTGLKLFLSLMCCALPTAKFWGKGKLPKWPVTVKDRFFGRRAKEKIRGGGWGGVGCALELEVP